MRLTPEALTQFRKTIGNSVTGDLSEVSTEGVDRIGNEDGTFSLVYPTGEHFRLVCGGERIGIIGKVTVDLITGYVRSEVKTNPSRKVTARRLY